MSYHLQTNAELELIPVGNGALGEELAVGASDVQAAELPNYTTHALVSVKDNDVLVTFDDSTPVSAGAGALLEVGYLEFWPKDRLAAAKFIEAVGAAAGAVRIEPFTPRG